MAAPNWCQACGRYHARDDQDCVIRERHDRERELELLADMIAARITERLAPR